MNLSAEQHERILAACAKGTNGDDIAKAENLRKSIVYQTIQEARKQGLLAPMANINPAAAQRDRILNTWAKGAKLKALADAEEVTETYIRGILSIARNAGDRRAISRSGKTHGEIINAHAAYSPAQLLEFDRKYKVALITAVDLGLETKEPGKLEYGVYRAARA